MTRFLIADDHPLFREALIGALKPYFADAVFSEACDFDETMRILKSNQNFNCVLLDLSMPGVEYLFGLIAIKKAYHDLPVIIVSANENIETIAQAMSLGASGFIPKSIPTAEFANAILAVMRGESWLPDDIKIKVEGVEQKVEDNIDRFKALTPKQMAVLSHIKTGLMNKQIAHEMDVSEATVKAHISAVLKKLGVKTRTQAILLLDRFQF